MVFVTRPEWGAVAPNGGPGRLAAAKVEGIALHWPGDSERRETRAEVAAGLRGWQRFHMEDRGYSDIAYQAAVDQAGDVYRLRGLRVQSGANGNEDLNERFGALLLVVAEGEYPSRQMVRSVRRVILRHRRMFRGSSRIVGHGQIRPGGTACPGPKVLELIHDGAFEPAAR